MSQCLKNNYNKLDLFNKLYLFYDIANGLRTIHNKGLIHKDLHSGNILSYVESVCFITDLGLCRPANEQTKEEKIYGVLPYVAPEVLRGKTYTQAADIYSFGIVACEILSGSPPYHDLSHNDELLAKKICQGLRPKFNIKVPKLVLHLIKQCLDANPLNRPTTSEIRKIVFKWRGEIKDKQSELNKQIKEADEINMNSPTSSTPSTSLSLSYETHSEAIYTSRLLNFLNQKILMIIINNMII